jgi:Fic family protein
MQTFRQLDRHFGSVPAGIVQSLGAIDVAKGRQEAFRQQHPAVLKTLTEIARIQSTEASNAIESITAPPRRIEQLVREKTKPANRSEAEIAGYRKVLDTIHASADHIPFKRTVVEQFHGDLYSFTGQRGGTFKHSQNDVKEYRPDGTVVVRFEPVGPFETPAAMDELHLRFTEAWEANAYPRLLLIAGYVFDFLMIHPFQDGNGRMSRLLTLLLLYHAGFEVGRFSSLEKLIDDSRETYYDSLQRSTVDWHEGGHDIWPWTSYFLGVMNAAYEAFETRTGAVSGRGAKKALVKQFIRGSVKDSFSIADIRQAAPGVSDPTIRLVLAELRDVGAIENEGLGPKAHWRRLHTNF